MSGNFSRAAVSLTHACAAFDHIERNSPSIDGLFQSGRETRQGPTEMLHQLDGYRFSRRFGIPQQSSCNADRMGKSLIRPAYSVGSRSCAIMPHRMITTHRPGGCLTAFSAARNSVFPLLRHLRNPISGRSGSSSQPRPALDCRVSRRTKN